MRGGIVGLALLVSAPAAAQSDMPVIPPPSQRDQPQRPPAIQGVPGPAVRSIDDLVREGFAVQAMTRSEEADGRGERFIVLLQRSGELRSCVMRVDPGERGTVPRRRSVCF